MRIAFSFSETESELSLRLWRWNIWRLADNKRSKTKSKRPAKTKDKSSKFGDFKFMIRVLSEPGVKDRVWRFVKKMLCRIYGLFSVKFKNVEIRGTLGDPFYDSIVYGISGGCYYPWESESWSAKGEIILRANFFRWLLFLFGTVYEYIVLVFILRRSSRRVKKRIQ